MESKRDAANSMASGIPSTRRQISATASASSKRDAAGATATARSTNNAAALDSTSNDGTGQSCSSVSRRPSRLVAMTLTVSGSAKDRLDHVGSRVQQMFAIVEHQQPRAALQCARDALGHGHPRLLGGSEHCCDRFGNSSGITDRRQLDHEHTVGEGVCDTRGHLQCQACLADSADTRQRHHLVVPERRPDFGELRLAADETRGR